MTFLSLDKQDIDKILSIQNGNFSDGWNERQLLSGFDSGNLSAVALEIEGKLVGFISYSEGLDSSDIESVVVISAERKKGYGKMLVDFALDKLKENAVKTVLLEVRESNLSAIALYKKCGFSQIAVRKKYYLNGENAIIMQKEL